MTEIGCRRRSGIGPERLGFRRAFVICGEARAGTRKNCPGRVCSSLVVRDHHDNYFMDFSDTNIGRSIPKAFFLPRREVGRIVVTTVASLIV
jgi:hypothetical protein